jgi:hypothetical protein
MPCYINIEDRYRLSAIRERQVFHTGLTTAAAIVAGGAIVGAGISAGGQMYASSQNVAAGNAAARAQAKTVGAALNQYNATTAGIVAAIQRINPNIQIPNFSLFPTEVIYQTNKKGKIKTDKKGNPIVKQAAQRGAVAESIEAANIINQNTLQQLEQILPGSTQARAQANDIATNWQAALEGEFERSKEAYKLLETSRRVVEEQLPQLGSARAVVDSMLKGDLSEQAKQQITRTIAETAGAGFSPEAARRTGFGQTPQAALSQNIMRGVEERQMMGLQAAQGITNQTLGLSGQFGQIAQQYGQTTQLLANVSEAARGWEGTRQSWQQLANAFRTRETDIMQIGLQGRGQDIQKEQYGIQNALEQQRIQAEIAAVALNAQTGSAAMAPIQSRLAAAQAGAAGTAGMFSTIGSGISSAASAYGQYSTAQPINYGSGATTGFRGQTYVPDQGGQVYRPVSGSIY